MPVNLPSSIRGHLACPNVCPIVLTRSNLFFGIIASVANSTVVVGFAGLASSVCAEVHAAASSGGDRPPQPTHSAVTASSSA